MLSLEDLKARLAEIEELEDIVRRELRDLKGKQKRIAKLERDSDELLEDYVGSSPYALDSLMPEQRHKVYKILRLKVTANEDGTAALDANTLPALAYDNLETLCRRALICPRKLLAAVTGYMVDVLWSASRACSKLFAANERWFLHEKGSVGAVDYMTAKPEGFSEAASRLLGCPGQDAEARVGSVSRYKELLAKVRESCAREVQYRELPGLRQLQLRDL